VRSFDNLAEQFREDEKERISSYTRIPHNPYPRNARSTPRVQREGQG
jgi:hypothetical protein